MGRAKRKRAAQQKQQQQDFVRKKTKLGKAKAPENRTSTQFKTRQIHVPNQSRPTPHGAEAASSCPTGLSLSDLLARTAHHNATTRATAFQTLTNASESASSVAHAAIQSRLPVVLSTAAAALSDDASNVRTAAASLILSAFAARPDACAPCLPSLCCHVLSAASHIRTQVRIHAARFITQVLCLRTVQPLDLFHEPHSPLPALGDMLSSCSSPRHRLDILTAIALCIATRTDGAQPDAMPSGTEDDLHARDKPFFYHAAVPASATRRAEGLLARLQSDDRLRLLARIAHIITEGLPSTTADTRDLVRTAVRTLDDFLVHGLHDSATALPAVGKAFATCRLHADSLETDVCAGVCSAAVSAKHIGIAIAFAERLFSMAKSSPGVARASATTAAKLLTAVSGEADNALSSELKHRVKTLALRFGSQFVTTVCKSDIASVRAWQKAVPAILDFGIVRGYPAVCKGVMTGGGLPALVLVYGRRGDADGINSAALLVVRVYMDMRQRVDASGDSLVHFVTSFVDNLCKDLDIVCGVRLDVWRKVVGMSFLAGVLLDDVWCRFVLRALCDDGGRDGGKDGGRDGLLPRARCVLDGLESAVGLGNGGRAFGVRAVAFVSVVWRAVDERRQMFEARGHNVLAVESVLKRILKSAHT